MSTNFNEFKLRNIEEFDADFVRNIRIAKQPPVKHTEKNVPSLIPELDKTVFSVKSPTQQSNNVREQQALFNNQINVQPAPPTQPSTPRPLVPIGSGQTVIPPQQERIGTNITSRNNPLDFDNIDLGEKTEAKKSSSPKGALALKIISLILLAVTIISFLLGCLFAVFLNSGKELAGYSFSTQMRDVTFETDEGEVTINEGSLVISKSLSANEYKTNMLISVPTTDELENKSSDVFSVGTVGELSENHVEFELIIPDSGESAGLTTSEDCCGLIEYYVPVIGGILSFTVSSVVNIVLVSALFILIIAFWSLLLLLSEKKLRVEKEN